MEKNVAVFFPGFILPEAKLKINQLISLVEKISRQPDIDSVAWLLVIILMLVYSKERERWGGEREGESGVKKKYKMYTLKRKRTLKHLMLELNLFLKEMTGIKNRVI